MTDTELLRKKIKQSGYKIQFIAKKLGISYQGLLNKINNKSEFRAKEIQILHDLLNLTEDERVAIFLPASRQNAYNIKQGGLYQWNGGDLS